MAVPYSAAVAELAAIVARSGKRAVTAAEIAEAINNDEAPSLDDAISRIMNLGPVVIRTARHVGRALSRMRELGAPIAVAVGGNESVGHWSALVSSEACQSVDDADSNDIVQSQPSQPPDLRVDPRSDPALHLPRAPKGYHLRGVSTLTDAAGNPVMQWVKTTQDRDGDRLDALLEAIKALPDSFRDAHQPTAPQQHLDSDLLCVYPIGDPHLGMYAWREETGADYDIKIAERLHVEAIRRLVSAAPSAKQALVVSLGDFFHCDSNLARTSRSGNPLDTDTRWQLVLRVGVRMMRAMVDAALAKHDHVRVIVEVGNHDDLSAVMLSMAMEAFYARDERVTVDTSPEPFHWHVFGKNLIGVTHGSESKPNQLPALMAAMKPSEWGQTRHRYWYVGHVHHERVCETPGCVVEHFRTLAPRDAWAHRAGYRADRDMRVDVLHREHGRITRHILGIEQLEES